MKKYFYSAVVAMMALFTVSCSQEETAETQISAPKKVSTSFSVGIPSNGPSTRTADASVTRYAVVIDNVDDAAAPWTVKLKASSTGFVVDYTDGDEQMKVQGSGNITIDGLTDGSKYVAYFWADYDDPANVVGASYDVTWATDIAVKSWDDASSSYKVGMAYCGSKSFTAGEDNGAGFSVTLKHAVAKVNFNQSASLTIAEAKTLAASCKLPVHYNLKTQSLIAKTDTWDTEGSIGISIAKTAGSEITAGELGSIYILAPDNGTTVSFWYTLDNWTTSNEIASVPLKSNYQTNISGQYFTSTPGQARFFVSSDDTWGTPANDITF